MAGIYGVVEQRAMDIVHCGLHDGSSEPPAAIVWIPDHNVETWWFDTVIFEELNPDDANGFLFCNYCTSDLLAVFFEVDEFLHDFFFFCE